MPAKNLSIGFSESVLYGGAGRNLELYYTNPLTWYHGEQLNKNKDDNTFIGFDVVWYPLRGLKLYGEMMIDDIQIEDKVASDNEPSEIGYLTGINLIEPIKGSGLDLSFEYTRINNWTYNQNKTYNRYIHDNKIIGHFLGPDRESYYLSAKKWFSFGAWAIFSYERQNSGEHNVFSDWDEPWLYTSTSYNDGFPSGVIEELDIIGVSIKIFHWNNLQFDIDNYFYFYDNKDNIEGLKSSNYRGRFQIRYLFGFSG
jgi:hypothetical protein